MALMDRIQVGKTTTTSGKARIQAEIVFWKKVTYLEVLTDGE